ncbi:MAG: xanthine dehydrogenase family protein molybdopterin-binding subunit [Nocardioides sp.]
MVGSLLGNAVRRVEDPELLTGRGTYVGNLVQPGDAHAVFVRSPFPHAVLTGIDISEALGAPGVLAVHTGTDAVGAAEMPGYWEAHPSMRRPALARDRVRYVGDPVALVIAETLAQAQDAAELIDVDYEPLPAVIDMEAALGDDTPGTYPAFTGHVAKTGSVGHPDPLAEAAYVVRLRTFNQRIATAPIEGNAVLADPLATPLNVWLGTQHPHDALDTLATETGLPTDQIRVVAPHVGGGFGGKAGMIPDTVVVVRAARALGRRVAWIESRTEAMLSMHGRGQLQFAELGLDEAGVITGLRLHLVGDCGAYGGFGGTFALGPSKMMAQGPYRIPKIGLTGAAVATNTAPMGAFRGAGRPEATALLERLMDLGATEIGLLPEEIRRRNLIHADEFPYRTQMRTTYDSGDYIGALDEALRVADVEALRAEQARRREAGVPRQLGIGLASYIEITFSGDDFGAVEIHDDGTATVRAGTSAHGQGHATAFAMIVADQLGLPMTAIRYLQSDTAVIPRGGGTGGSRSLQAGGTAVREAAELLLAQAREVAAGLLEVDGRDIAVAEGGLGVNGVPGRVVTWAELAVAARESGDPLLVEHDFAGRDNTFPFGTHVAVVEVDVETGAVHPLRLIAVDDCGVIVNPLLVAGQQHGGAAQGMSQALWEEFVYDADGTPLTSTFADYPMPSAADTISFEVSNTVTPTPANPLGVKGIGEAATIGATPAFQNAVIDAVGHLGVRHIEMPCTPEKVWNAIQHPGPAPWSSPPSFD